eukprot:CAMPEP_0181300976 /NCGR_PEP_ID=MMETSP1101-20121128/7179_1 /TAXON_ID=46948 /ORGANISM="Rhodomonas abbreviata, Strain Caron Lab Isolate" /LENGTH=356 /DNA_ID=CAMNT_0023406253 /DNA_START=153 /DNA_END=1220 /DNA_ORIENTATION=-
MSEKTSNPSATAPLQNGGHEGSKKVEALQGAFWFPFFAFSSVSMVLLNKYCASSFGQPYSLLGFQNTMTILLNLLGVQLGIFSVKPSQFKMFFLPTFLFVGMLLSSLKGLPFVSVATTVVFRALSTCLVACGDFLIFKKRFLKAEYVCLVFVVGGAAIYAAADLSYDATGYAWMVCNTAFFVSSQLYEKYAIVALEQTPAGISCVQNSMSLPILLVFGMFVGKEEPIAKLRELDSVTHGFLFATGFAGCALSVCYMSLSKFASATSISLAGNLNKLLSIVAGAFVFSNPLSLLQVVGLGISMLATMAFSQKGQLPLSLPVRKSARMAWGLTLLVITVFASNYLWLFRRSSAVRRNW